MIEWFTVVFANNTEQAKLFTVAISTILAVSIVLLNQLITSRRGKNERLIEKAEELTETVFDFFSLGVELNQSLMTNIPPSDANLDKLRMLRNKLYKLGILYFRNCHIPIQLADNIIATTSHFAKSNQEELEHSTGQESYRKKMYVTQKDELDKWLVMTTKTIRALTKKHIK